MSRVSNTADAQLERILYILPAAARGGRVRIDEIARALDVDASTVLRDLEHATARSFFHPAGAVESFTITTDGRTLQVHAPHEFQRPVRLNQREALALGLGLRMLATDAEPPRRAAILAVAARLESELTVPEPPTRAAPPPHRPTAESHASEDVGGYDVEYDYEQMAVAFDDDGFRGVVADAIELQRTCTIWYLKPGEQAPQHRRIAPYRLVYAAGTWYVAAYDIERDGLRFFRMDRVLDAGLTDEAAPAAPAALHEMLAQGVPYNATDEVEVQVRYSPQIARWIIEQTSAPLEDDGSALVRHRVADPRWIVRHVLQYGGDAVVEQPRTVRQWVAEAAAQVVAAEPAS